MSVTTELLTVSTSHTDAASIVEAVRTIRLSDEQLAIAAAVQNRNLGNIIVVARAGTGKTFLILQCLALVAGRSIVVAYNTKIAREIKEKIAKSGNRYAEGSTFHGLGDRVMKALFPKAKLEGRGPKNAGYTKITRVMNEVKVTLPNGEDSVGIPKYLTSFVKRCVSMAMSQGFGVAGMQSAKNLVAWREMVAHYRIDSTIADDSLESQLAIQAIRAATGREMSPSEAREEIIQYGIRYSYACLNHGRKLLHEVYSYDDMLWAPLLLNADIPTYDFVFVDEAQDSNPVRVEWAARMIRNGGRIMFVGDNFQAIYGFVGAMSNALDKIRTQFNCSVFKMTVTYRCSKAVAANAAKMVPDFRAAETNAEGSVSYINEDEFAELALVPGHDAIICRNTRPLVAVAFDLIRRGIPCHIEGKEIGGDLVNQIDNIDRRITSIAKFLPRMDEWLDKQVLKLMKAEAEMEAEALTDKIETLRVVMLGLPHGSTVDDAKAKIVSLFGNAEDEPRPTVALMTAHKSKGLEFTRVFGWGVSLYMPSKRAVLEHEIEQEFNAEYVLKTRSIMDYVEVSVKPPAPKR